MRDSQIVHLVDDTMAGDIKRLLAQFANFPRSSSYSRQEICAVKSGAFSHGKFRADAIISHLSIRWRSLPALIALRAIHPNTMLVHVEHSYTKALTTSDVQKRKRFSHFYRLHILCLTKWLRLARTKGAGCVKAILSRTTT